MKKLVIKSIIAFLCISVFSCENQNLDSLSNNNEQSQLNALAKEYSLKKLQNVTPDLNYLNFKSPKEAEDFLKRVKLELASMKGVKFKSINSEKNLRTNGDDPGKSKPPVTIIIDFSLLTDMTITIYFDDKGKVSSISTELTGITAVTHWDQDKFGIVQNRADQVMNGWITGTGSLGLNISSNGVSNNWNLYQIQYTIDVTYNPTTGTAEAMIRDY